MTLFIGGANGSLGTHPHFGPVSSLFMPLQLLPKTSPKTRFALQNKELPPFGKYRMCSLCWLVCLRGALIAVLIALQWKCENQGCARFAKILLSARYCLCSVDFHNLTLQLIIQTQNSVAPELQVFCEFTWNFSKTSTPLLCEKQPKFTETSTTPGSASDKHAIKL